VAAVVPAVAPVVLEAWRYAATCPHCGTTTAAEYPVGFEHCPLAMHPMPED